jgi:hypothetical protein
LPAPVLVDGAELFVTSAFGVSFSTLEAFTVIAA